VCIFPQQLGFVQLSQKNYLFPKFLNDTTIIAKVSGLDEITRFVSINTKSGKERTLYTPGYTEDVPFSLMAGKIAWTEQEQNYRWSNAEQSNVWIYDLGSGKVKRLTKGKRFFAPAISPDGKTISVVHVSESVSYNILFLDLHTGKITDTIQTPGNMFPMTPVWTPDGNKLVTIIFTPEGKQIYYLSLTDKKWHTVTSTTYSNIRHPFVTKYKVGFDDNGKLIADSPTRELQKLWKDKEIIEVEFKEETDVEILRTISGVTDVQRVSGTVFKITATTGAEIRENIYDFSKESKLTLLELKAQEIKLEDVFE